MIIILEIMRLQGSGGISEGMKTTRALLSVGKAVEQEYEAEMLRHSNTPVPVDEQALNGLASIEARRNAAKALGSRDNTWCPDWTQAVRVRVGSFLVDALMDVANVTRKTKDSTSGEE